MAGAPGGTWGEGYESGDFCPSRAGGLIVHPGPVLARLLPGLTQLHGYRKAWLRADIVAGVTVAGYLVPQVMAYATVAGLPPVVGLWAAIGPLVVYPLLATSRQLSVGPESTTAVLAAVTLAPLAAGQPDRYAALAAVLAVLVGGVCLAAALARLGVLADMLSKPVLVGYLAGIAGPMIVGQLGAVTGVPISGTDVAAQVRSLAAHLGDWHWPTVLLAAAVLATLVVLAWRTPRVPGPLLAVSAATAVVAVLDLARYGIEVVGTIPADFPTLQIPQVSSGDDSALLLPAVGIAVSGSPAPSSPPALSRAGTGGTWMPTSNSVRSAPRI